MKNSPGLIKPDARPWGMRLFEAASLSSFLVFEVLGWWRLLGAETVPEGWNFLTLALAGAVGWVLADVASGVVHFAADNFGNPETRIWGPVFIRPFREHHDNPRLILTHSFLERNGNNSALAVTVIAWQSLFEPGAEVFGWFIRVVCLSLAFWVSITNEIHAWSHALTNPFPVRLLQRAGLVLSRRAHSKHHLPPHVSHYCITSGFVDRLLPQRFWTYLVRAAAARRSSSAGL